jgi:hypothetical protein
VPLEAIFLGSEHVLRISRRCGCSVSKKRRSTCYGLELSRKVLQQIVDQWIEAYVLAVSSLCLLAWGTLSWPAVFGIKARWHTSLHNQRVEFGPQTAAVRTSATIC